VKICVINARISKDVLDTKVLKEFYKEALNKCSLILCKSGYEKEKYLKLGVNDKLLFTIGNLKYSYVPDFSDELSSLRNEKSHEEIVSKFQEIDFAQDGLDPVIFADKKNISISNKNMYFLMASTHEPDEKNFLNAIKYLNKENISVVIAPRHISRAKKIYKYLKKNNIETFLYSYLEEEERYMNYGVLIIDTFGDLPKFYYDARYIYVGGGFSKRGVQNVIEPSTYGRPILVGPNIDNFYEEIINLRKDKGITVIEDNDWIPVQENIAQHIRKLNDLDDETLGKMGGAAKAYSLKFNDIIEKYVKLLKEERIIN